MTPEQSAVKNPGQKHFPPWSIVLAVVFVVVTYVVTQIAGQIIVSFYPLLRGWPEAQATNWLNASTYAQFAYILIVEALSVGAIYLFIRRYKVSFKALGLLRPRFKDLGLALLCAPLYFGGYIALLSVLTKVFPSLNVEQKQQIGFDAVHGFIPLALTFISLAVLPPLVEEIMMRGFLFESLKKRFKVGLAIIVTSALFASAHLQFGSGAPLLWVAAVDTFTLSLVLCVMKQKTGSLWPGIFLHCLKNSIAFLSIFIFHLS